MAAAAEQGPFHVNYKTGIVRLYPLTLGELRVVRHIWYT